MKNNINIKREDNFKIAFLLIAGYSATSINRFISQALAFKGSYIFIHIDKKSRIDINDIKNSKRVFICPNQINVEWGDYSQIQATKMLMEYSYSFESFNYYSIHSESDMFVRPVDELIEFLINDKAYAYLWCHRLPYKYWQFGGGLGRIEMHWPQKLRKKYKWNSPYRIIRAIYGRLYCFHIFKRKQLPKEIEFWGRCNWFTISNDCLRDILDYVHNHIQFDDIFKDALSGDEIYFTTLVCNLGKSKKVITNNCLCYIDFNNYDYKKPGSPKELDISDIKKIDESKYFFARKFVESNNTVIDYYLDKTLFSSKRKHGKINNNHKS